jgi:hypothetical protein
VARRAGHGDIPQATTSWPGRPHTKKDRISPAFFWVIQHQHSYSSNTFVTRKSSKLWAATHLFRQGRDRFPAARHGPNLRNHRGGAMLAKEKKRRVNHLMDSFSQIRACLGRAEIARKQNRDIVCHGSVRLRRETPVHALSMLPMS